MEKKSTHDMKSSRSLLPSSRGLANGVSAGVRVLRVGQEESP